MRASTFLFASTLLLPACAGLDGDAEVWRFAIEETRGSVQHRYATEFAERIEEGSGGDIDVRVYPYGTLGTSDHLTELLYNGTLQLATASPGHLGKLLPEVQVFLLHFVLSDDDAVNDAALRDPELLALFDELYAEKGFDLLTVFSEGWMVWTTATPVRSPSDFDGIKMRVMTSPLLLEAYATYGASPTPLPYAEVYSALQLSMIDGQVNPVFAVEEMSFYEVTDAITIARHSPFVTTVVANDQFIEELSPERRALLEGTIADLQDHIRDEQHALAEERLQSILDKRPDMQVIELTGDEREAFRQASLPVRERFLELAPGRGQEVLDTLLAAVQRAEAAAEPPSPPEGEVPEEQGDAREGEQ